MIVELDAQTVSYLDATFWLEAGVSPDGRMGQEKIHLFGNIYNIKNEPTPRAKARGFRPLAFLS